MIPVQIPPMMLEHIHTEQDKAWLRQLPELVASCTRLWNLQPSESLVADFVIMKVNYIVPVLYGETEAVLKVMLSERTFAHERRSMQLSKGDGCAELLQSDEALRAMLLERVTPGVPLAEHPDDEENTRVAAQLMRKYWREAPADHGLPTVEELLDSFAQLREKHDGSTGPIPQFWVERAEEAFVELTATGQGPVVLHGDMHHWNILSAQRQPWLAIDPQGRVGDRGYDCVALMGNRPSRSCAGKDEPRLLGRRAEILAEELEQTREWVLTWCWATAVLSAVRYQHEWESHIARAEVLRALV